MLVFVGIAILLVGAEAKLYKDCGSKLATVQIAGVSGCSQDATECILKRNSNVTVSIQFTPKQEISTLVADVHGIMMNMPIPFPLADKDACKDKGLVCPLKPDVSVTYHAIIPVLKSYPKVTVGVQWELKNEKDEDVVCVLIPSRIS